jgi:nucleoredoxin
MSTARVRRAPRSSGSMRRSSSLAVVVALVLGGGAGAALSASGPPDVAETLRGRLVRLHSGRLAATPPPSQARYVAFYFGASWCGPCRAFQPELRRGYARLRAAGAPVEIVYVSDDRSCPRMAEYIAASRMPWPAVACRDRDRLAWLQRARGAALPGLLVYRADGALVATSWSGSGNSRPREALAELERLAARR